MRTPLGQVASRAEQGTSRAGQVAGGMVGWTAADSSGCGESLCRNTSGWEHPFEVPGYPIQSDWFPEGICSALDVCVCVHMQYYASVCMSLQVYAIV